MSEYEIIDALISIRADVAQHSMNFITVLFAYIVAAYFVGSKLSRFQVSRYRQVNFLRLKESSLGPQATALSHSVNALFLRSR